MTDPLTLLRDADPAARLPDADGSPPRDVLDRIVATRPPRRRRRAPRRLVLASAAGAVAVATLLGVLAPDERTDLAARAYAATAPDEGVLYTELTTESVMPGHGIERSVTRVWQRRDRSRRIRTLVDAQGRTRTVPGLDRPWVYEYVQRDGVLRALMPEGEVQTLRESDDPDARDILEQERTSFVETFRASYADAVLHDAGRTTFAGRPAQAYEVEARAPALRETYYLDPGSGLPLGSVRTLALRDPESGRPTAEGRFTEVLRRMDRLPATPENLARLTAPWADAQPRWTPSPTGQLTPVPPRPQ